MVSVEKISYQGWPNCYRLSNDQVDLIITTDVGPRIIRFGFVGEANEFVEFPEQMGRMGEAEWLNFGGHRLWHAPESKARTYFADSGPVKFEQHDGFVRTIQDVEPTTGIQKEMDITLDPKSAKVTVVHRLRNTGLWAVELAPWALSVMAPGGVAILPQPPRGSHTENLLPTNRLVLWAYTDMSDARWTWGQRFVLLRQDAAATAPQKVGMSHTPWIAYARAGHLFVKQFPIHPAAPYVDMGCSVETFTNNRMLEVETLAPLVTLGTGEIAEHTESWSLFQDVPMPAGDADVMRDVLPLI